MLELLSLAGPSGLADGSHYPILELPPGIREMLLFEVTHRRVGQTCAFHGQVKWFFLLILCSWSFIPQHTCLYTGSGSWQERRAGAREHGPADRSSLPRLRGALTGPWTQVPGENGVSEKTGLRADDQSVTRPRPFESQPSAPSLQIELQGDRSLSRVTQRCGGFCAPRPDCALHFLKCKTEISAEGPAAHPPHPLQRSVTQEWVGVSYAFKRGCRHPLLQRQLENSLDAFTQKA